MKVAVAGNGAIGCLLAKKLTDLGLQVDHFCDTNRLGCASRAAGAMLNVISEIDVGQFDLPHLEMKVLAGMESLSHWQELARTKQLNLHKILNYGFKITKSASTDFERSQLDYLLDQVRCRYPHFVDERESEIRLPYETFLDAREYLLNLDCYLESANGYRRLSRLEPWMLDGFSENSVCVSGIEYSQLFLCVGSQISDFRSYHPALFDGCQEVFHGIGSALLCQPTAYDSATCKSHDNDNSVIRTLNRGGGCGYHYVPLKGSSAYIGATNAISASREFGPRLGSLEILAKGTKELLDQKLNNHIVTSLTGCRPTSLDLVPLLGRLNNTCVHICTGTKRDGLTLSPVLTEMLLIESGLIDNSALKTDFGFSYVKALEIFKPDRCPYSYFSLEEAAKRYSLSSYSGMYMHGNTDLCSTQKEKIYERYQSEYRRVHQQSLGSSCAFAFHGELINMFRYDRVSTHTLKRIKNSYKMSIAKP